MLEGGDPRLSATDATAAMPSCTVVVCTRNRPEQLDACLSAVRQLDHPDFDVIVVDNAPFDDGARRIAARHHARYLLEPVQGLSRSRNLGAWESKAEIVAFLDDDAVPQRDWLRELVREFADPAVAAVAGRIYALEEDTARDRRYASISGAPLGGTRREVFDRSTPQWFERANFGAVGNGANMAFRRSLFASWAGFEERLGAGRYLGGGEESYAFFELIDRGHRVVYTPAAKVNHPFPLTESAFMARYLRDQRTAVAYLAFLWWEQPRYRKVIVRYAREALSGTPRAWRTTATSSTHEAVPRWRAWVARASGLMLFLRSRVA